MIIKIVVKPEIPILSEFLSEEQKKRLVGLVMQARSSRYLPSVEKYDVNLRSKSLEEYKPYHQVHFTNLLGATAESHEHQDIYGRLTVLLASHGNIEYLVFSHKDMIPVLLPSNK